MCNNWNNEAGVTRNIGHGNQVKLGGTLQHLHDSDSAKVQTYWNPFSSSKDLINNLVLSRKLLTNFFMWSKKQLLFV